ncbi:unnamed protein product [Dibothriocephalus latus]|uniref:Uncharacterized protein n=1 Tax=Dibothriocephalus latus TaxID=60516 RepID=A0A3P7LH49_DIBLA|nr:unnamed protein product [Dibothriocephalus latus]
MTGAVKYDENLLKYSNVNLQRPWYSYVLGVSAEIGPPTSSTIPFEGRYTLHLRRGAAKTNHFTRRRGGVCCPGTADATLRCKLRLQRPRRT